MKFIIHLFLIIVLSIAAHAQSIYCPAQIICAEDDNVDACVFPQTLRGYWEWVPAKHPRPILAGVYHHTYVSAPDETTLSGYAICVYTHAEVHQTLSLRSQSAFMLIANLATNSQWRSEESWWECVPDDREQCPMREMRNVDQG